MVVFVSTCFELMTLADICSPLENSDELWGMDD
jgi:hypothetical protein